MRIMRKRGQLDVIFDIMRVLRENDDGLIQLHIIAKANLTHMKFKDRIPKMIELGIIVKEGIKYRLSPLGFNIYDKISILESLREQK